MPTQTLNTCLFKQALLIFGLTLGVQTSAQAASFCLVTHHEGAGSIYGKIAAGNHSRYAERHGYLQQTHTSRVSGERFVDPSRGDIHSIWGGGLFWQKVAAVELALKDGVTNAQGEAEFCQWVVWLDSDAIIANFSNRLEDLVAIHADHYETPKDILLSRERDHPINTGVFFIRNTEEGRAFIKAVGDMYPLYKNNALPDQTAFATVAFVMEPWPSDQASQGLHPAPHPKVGLVPQRTFDSFYSNLYDFGPHGAWQPGDFIAHFAGTYHYERAKLIEDFIEENHL